VGNMSDGSATIIEVCRFCVDGSLYNGELHLLKLLAFEPYSLGQSLFGIFEDLALYHD